MNMPFKKNKCYITSAVLLGCYAFGTLLHNSLNLAFRERKLHHISIFSGAEFDTTAKCLTLCSLLKIVWITEKKLLHSSLNLAFRQRKLHHIFIFSGTEFDTTAKCLILCLLLKILWITEKKIYSRFESLYLLNQTKYQKFGTGIEIYITDNAPQQT